jgi:hypothetical protein
MQPSCDIKPFVFGWTDTLLLPQSALRPAG